MSFTAEVKDELSRIEGTHREEQLAELAALVRIDGTLGLSGRGRYSLAVDTETASVARRILMLLRQLYGLRTELATRRSILHKTLNFLITIPSQPGLAEALAELGVVSEDGGLEAGIAARLVETTWGAAGYLRGAFLARGFVADPHGDAHFELTVESERLASDIAALMTEHQVPARSVRRRNSHIVYLKGTDQIIGFLAFTGAHRCALAMEDARLMKSVRNDVNRRVNAEVANHDKSTRAGVEQVRAIRRLATVRGLDSLPPALAELARLRLAHPDASLKELGELSDPPLSKSAVAHRVRRIEQLASELDGPRPHGPRSQK